MTKGKIKVELPEFDVEPVELDLYTGSTMRREYMLLRFQHDLKDDKDFSRSELLQAFRQMDFEPAHVHELYALSTSKKGCPSERVCARNTIWQTEDGTWVSAIGIGSGRRMQMDQQRLDETYDPDTWFLVYHE